MKLKKLLALCLCLLFAVSVFAACKNNTDADEDISGNQDGTSVELYTTPYDASDWSEFDALVAEIKAETDFVKREELMHKAEDILIVVQVNGKVRARINIDPSLDDESVKQAALANEAIVKYLEDKSVKKVIYVKGRLVNIVAA